MEQNPSIQEQRGQNENPALDPMASDGAAIKSDDSVQALSQSTDQKPITNNTTGSKKENTLLKDDERPDKSEELGKKFETLELWNQIYKHTKSIEIDEDKDFFWPEPRKYSEEVVQELLSKRIMFVRSLSEEWLYAAVQRLASVLQSSSRLENLVLRITRSSLSFQNTAKEQLEFGFWSNQRRLPWPVLVFVSSNRQDIVQNFLGSNRETVVNQIYDDLKKTNLFIVCEVEDNVSNRDLFKRFKKRIHGVFAVWDVPVIKLHIMKHLGKRGKSFLEKLEETDLFKSHSERSIYDGLTEIDLENEKDVTDTLCEKLLKAGSDIESRKAELSEVVAGEDFISKVVIFCGAFFDGLYYPDFYKLVFKLLLDERQQSHNYNQKVDSKLPSPAAESPLLAEIWQKNADRILNACFLETKRESGNNRVGFVIPQLAAIMAEHIETRHYPLFHRMYKNFIKTGLLTDPDLNEKLEPYIIRFFTIAAKMDTATHNAKWLKEVVYDLWRFYKDHLPADKSYEEIMLYLQREKRIASIVFHRIPQVIGGLLTNNNDQFKDIVSDFFRLLLNEVDAKEIAIIIAAYIYKEYRFTEVFPAEDLMSYFKKTLDEGYWEESFFAYDTLTENMDYRELQEETKKWIDSTQIADTSYTKQFAFLYQLHFILITVFRYFRQFRAEATYELWDVARKEFFPESFRNLMKDLLDERCFRSIESIFNNEHGYQRFKNFVEYFEVVESRKTLDVAERFIPPYNQAYTLVADVLEVWFYILTLKSDLFKIEVPADTSWVEYGQMITTYCSLKYLRLIKKYWSDKSKFYSIATDRIKTAGKEDRRREETYLQQLKRRKYALKVLTQFVQLSGS